MPPQLEKNHVVPTAWQDETLARDGVSIRWIIKKAREFQKNIYFCFIDYAKAFDCMDIKTDHCRRKKKILILRRVENKARRILLISIYVNERKQI